MYRRKEGKALGINCMKGSKENTHTKKMKIALVLPKWPSWLAGMAGRAGLSMLKTLDEGIFQLERERIAFHE